MSEHDWDDSLAMTPPEHIAPPSAASEERKPYVMTPAVKLPPPKVTPKVRASEELQTHIEGFGDLKEDWDSYGAPPIQTGAITLALDLLTILAGTPHEITGASPTNDEAILLDTKSGMGIEVSIYGN